MIRTSRLGLCYPVHVFGPAAGTWHVDGESRTLECYEMLPGRWGNGTADCKGVSEYVDGAAKLLNNDGPVGQLLGRSVATTAAPNTTESAACDVTAAFCARFVGGAAAIRRGALLQPGTTAL
jgi:hypothetical protein